MPLRIAALPSLCLFASLVSLTAAQSTLWQIGHCDTNNADFALAPNRYEAFEEDGLFIVGHSESKVAWPYVHPGPDDDWAGHRQHTFTVLFGVKQAASEGNCRLLVDLIDTHQFKPATLNLEINGQKFEQKLPAGAGNDSISACKVWKFIRSESSGENAEFGRKREGNGEILGRPGDR